MGQFPSRFVPDVAEVTIGADVQSKLLSSLAAVAALGAAQLPDATIILSEEEEVELWLPEAFEACGRVSGLERSVCLANLSLEIQSAEPCEADPTGECAQLAGRTAMTGCGHGRSDDERAACELEIARRYAAPDSCEVSSVAEACLGIVASERRDPSIIDSRIEDPRTRQTLLGFYAVTTGDLSAVDLIEDNYHADGLLMVAATAKAARTGEWLDPGFCWAGLRGNYEWRDGYLENFDHQQVICAAAVGWVNKLNDALHSAETPSERESILEQLRQLQDRFESEPASGFFTEDELRHLAGLPSTSPAKEAVDELRGWAESSRAACDFVSALELGNQLREAVARWSAESAESAPGGARHEAWLIAHYDEVASKAARQAEFRTLVAAAQDIGTQTVGFADESDLAAAESLLRLARTKALTDPGCTDLAEVDGMLAGIASDRQLREQLRAEQEAEQAKERERARVAAAEGDEWTAGSRADAAEEWPSGARSDEVDPCAGPRPEYEAALERLRLAVARAEADGVIAALRAGGLTPRCPGDRERLESLRGIGVAVAEADARAKNQRMASAIGQAGAAAADLARAWRDAASGLERILGEYNRQREAAGPASLFGGTAVAPAGGGAAGSAGTPAGGKASCLVDGAVARSSAAGDPFWIQEIAVAGGMRAFKILQLAARPAGGAHHHGPFRDEASVARELERLCPASARGTGSIRLQ